MEFTVVTLSDRAEGSVMVAEARIRETRPDYIVILPWNLRDEIAGQLGYVREWGGQFVTLVPRLTID